MPFIGPDECEWETFDDYVWCDVLGMCGCHDDLPFERMQHLLRGLYAANVAGESWYYEWNERTDAERGLDEILLHLFSDKELTEHGSSVRGSWLTDKGIEIAKQISPASGETKENEMEQKPSIGRIVHYQRYGSPGGEHKAEPSPAMITQVLDDAGKCQLFVMNPNGVYFNPTPFAATPTPGCWNWPPRV